MSSNVTVNGASVKDWVRQQSLRKRDEAGETRIPVKTMTREELAAISSPGIIIAPAALNMLTKPSDVKATHVIVAGMTFPWEAKAPFVMSGMSVFGGIEYNQEADEVKCHVCGRWFKSLSMHMKKHGISTREYRISRGISIKRSLNSSATRKKRSAIAGDNLVAAGNRTIFTKGSRAASGSARAAFRHATARAALGAGFAVRPETANLAGKCMAQITHKIQELAHDLGRTPTLLEFRVIGVHHRPVTKLFGMPFREILKSLGLTPRKRAQHLPGPPHDISLLTFNKEQQYGKTVCR